MSSEKKLKDLFYSDTRKICRESGIYLDVEFDENSMDLISELAWKKLKLFALDLEAFAKHAKRSTINVDDVKLLVRRNDSLKQLVEEKSKILSSTKGPEEAAGTKRKRKTSSVSSN